MERKEILENLEPGEATRLLSNLQDTGKLGVVIGLLYQDLRRIAGNLIHGSQTLQPTALVNEVFIHLSGRPCQNFENSAHFLNTAGLIMRQLLMKYARAQGAKKRGGDVPHGALDDGFEPGKDMPDPNWIIHVDAAFDRLKELDQRKYKVSVLRHYLGFSLEEIARVLTINPRTVRRDWEFCRIWLAREIQA